MSYSGGATVKELKKQVSDYKKQHCPSVTGLSKAKLEKLVGKLIKEKVPFHRYEEELQRVIREGRERIPKKDSFFEGKNKPSSVHRFDELVYNIERELKHRNLPPIDLIPEHVFDQLHDSRDEEEAHHYFQSLMEYPKESDHQKEILEKTGDPALLLIADEIKRLTGSGYSGGATVKELKGQLRQYKSKNCPRISGLKKAELQKLVEKLIKESVPEHEYERRLEELIKEARGHKRSGKDEALRNILEGRTRQQRVIPKHIGTLPEYKSDFPAVLKKFKSLSTKIKRLETQRNNNSKLFDESKGKAYNDKIAKKNTTISNKRLKLVNEIEALRTKHLREFQNYEQKLYENEKKKRQKS